MSPGDSTPGGGRTREAERRQVNLLQAICIVFDSDELAELQTGEQVEVLADGRLSGLLGRLARFCGHDTLGIGPGRRRRARARWTGHPGGMP